jgi:hypothetical protein
MFKLSNFFLLDDLAEDLTPTEIIALSCVLIGGKAPVSGGLKQAKSVHLF